MTEARERAVAAFRELRGGPPDGVAVAPGRVNLIGEHVDYEDGFVLPVAIDRSLAIAFRRRSDRSVVVASLERDETSFDLDRLERRPGHWAELVKGVASGRAGWDGVVASDVSIGAGLSSSAALAVAALLVDAAVSGRPWEPLEAARAARRAEAEWTGVGCGIMDPLAIVSGREGCALLVDCRSLEVRPVPLPDGAVVVVLDTGTRRELAASAYEARRDECRAAAEALGVAALRDASLELLAARGAGLAPATFRRARHVVSENARTLEAVRAGAPAFGRLLDASHASLRDDFEVSSPALDRIVQLARRRPECFGARMTGAGFGGCAVALVRAGEAEGFAEAVAGAYSRATGLPGAAYPCRASAGARVEAL